MQPGDFGLSTIQGPVGWMVNIGQSLLGDSSRFTHAFVVLDDETVVEAMPGGTKITPLSEYRDRAVFSTLDLTPEQRYAIVHEARNLVGTPYSFLDYLALGCVHYKIKARWVRKYVQQTGHMICSQLVDEAYKRAGVHLFNDGRLSQDVTPGDLTYVIFDAAVR